MPSSTCHTGSEWREHSTCCTVPGKEVSVSLFFIVLMLQNYYILLSKKLFESFNMCQYVLKRAFLTLLAFAISYSLFNIICCCSLQNDSLPTREGSPVLPLPDLHRECRQRTAPYISWRLCLPQKGTSIFHPVHCWTVFIHCAAGPAYSPVPRVYGYHCQDCKYDRKLGSLYTRGQHGTLL